MITQRLKIDGQNIVKDDGSLFTPWGHNYDNLNIPDAGLYNAIIEDAWEDNLYATGGIFTINQISWVANGVSNSYDITLKLNETLLNDTFTIGKTLITIAGSSSITATLIGGGATVFSIEGSSVNMSNPGVNTRSPITAIDINANTITFTQYFESLNIQNGSATCNGTLGVGSIELDLAILNKIANTKIIRVCLQLDKFMLDDAAYKAALDNSGGDTTDEQDADTGNNQISSFAEINTDPYQVNSNQLQKLYEFCDLAAKYDIYVIINGANSWVAGNQPDWLAWATEEIRWAAQKSWWSAVALTIGNHVAVAWYSLINEPIDQNEDFVFFQPYGSSTVVTDKGDESYDIKIFVTTKEIADSITKAFNISPPLVGYDFDYLDQKYNKPGYAIITDKNQALDDDGNPLVDDLGDPVYLNYCALARYSDLKYSSENFTLTISGVTIESFGEPNADALVAIGEDIIDPNRYSLIYLSFIDKAANSTDLKIKAVAGSASATIDLSSNRKQFQGLSSSSTYSNDFGFVGESAYTAFSSTLLSIFSNLTKRDYGSTSAILSSVSGYGQIFTNYPSGNTYKINAVNFGHADFLSYGLNSSNTRGGYNDQFFIQSLRFVLSRLRSKSVTKFTSGSFTSGTSVSQSLSGVSGYTYRKSTANATAQFTTSSSFAGETVAIGFMVENGASATATITVNDKTYIQSLISGTDVLSNSSDALPVVKRIENIQPGTQTITVQLNVISGSACLDYWQIESASPAPIIVSSIDNNALPSTVNSTYGNPVINWNQKIVELISSEFIDGLVYFVDINTPLNSTSCLTYPADYTGTYQNATPNSSGRTKMSTGYTKLIAQNNLIPNYGISVSGLDATYACTDPHGLQVQDDIVIINASPSILNGSFKVSAVISNYKFQVKLPSTISILPSVASPAGFYQITLQPNTTYKVSTGSTSIPEETTFTTGSAVTGDSNGYYAVTLTNFENVQSSPNNDFESCTITNETQWIGGPFYQLDKHYNPYVTLTPLTATGRTKYSIARDWMSTMINAIKEIDQYTPITISNINFSGNGFSPDNTNDLIDIISPHQYITFAGYTMSMTNLVNNLATCSSYNKPVVLEEGAVPTDSSAENFAIAQEYLLKSKVHFAGALNNYQGIYDLNGYFQSLFKSLGPFMDDAPINDVNKTTEIVTSYGSNGNDDTNVNKPRILGRRVLSPIGDISNIDFAFYNQNVPSYHPGLNIDGSYTLQRQLVKSGSTFPSSSYVYFNNLSVINNPALRVGLNGFKKSTNQKIVSINTVANFQLTDNPMILRNYIPVNYSPTPVASNSGWTIYQSSGTYDIVSIMNVTNNTTLSSNLNIDDTYINVTSVTPFANATGVIKIGNEYIKYSAKSTSPARLTIASNGRGFRGTRPELTYTNGTTVIGSMPNTSYGISTSSVSNPTAQWPLTTPASTPNGRTITQVVAYACVSVDTPLADLTDSRGTTASTSIPSGSTTAQLTFLSSTWPSSGASTAFRAGAAVSGGNIPSGATISSVSSNKLNISFPQTTSSKTVSNGTNVYAEYRYKQQCAKITITDRTGFFPFYSISYKGTWVSGVTYSAGDVVYYQNALWQTSSEINATPNTGSWSRYSLSNDYVDTSNGFVWIPIVLSYILSAFGYLWVDPIYNTVDFQQYFDPTNLGIKIQNSNTSTPESTKNIKVAKIYADSYISGYLEPVGRSVLEAQLWKTADFAYWPNINFEKTASRIDFTAPLSNINNQWFTSGNTANPVIDGEILELDFTETNSLNNNMEIRFALPIRSTTSSTLLQSYMTANVLRINTAYVEVKIRETLARKGTSIVSMG